MSLRFGLTLLGVVLVNMSSESQAQAPGRWGCQADSLAGFNCARYYDGTVTLTSELKGSVQQSFRIVATVTGGRVKCKVSGTDVEEFEAPGMLAVVHEASQVVGGGYSIDVWCPEEAGGATHRGTEAQIKIMKQRAADYAKLEGKDAYESPNADAANGITGTETITWALRRP
ncbi:MAG TPA: hypothetical protein VKD28_16665 [Gemmatimonadales bacterium]|nr:hypothetical protein [Gemmatimonadales bacterium]